jgi:hypothetical protein
MLEKGTESLLKMPCQAAFSGVFFTRIFSLKGVFV